MHGNRQSATLYRFPGARRIAVSIGYNRDSPYSIYSFILKTISITFFPRANTIDERKKCEGTGIRTQISGYLLFQPLRVQVRLDFRAVIYGSSLQSFFIEVVVTTSRADPLPIILVTGAREDARLPHAPT